MGLDMLLRKLRNLAVSLTTATVAFASTLQADPTTLAVQRALKAQGYAVGALDGIWGRNTRSALESFLRDKGQEFDGVVDQTELELLGIAIPDSNAESPTGLMREPARNPQWHRYETQIATPLRALRVPSDFTLVENWTDLMQVHDRRLTGDFDEESHYYSSRIDFDKCVADLSSTTTTTSSISGDEGVVPISAMCHSMLGARFNNNPKKYAGYYRQILLNWLTEGTLHNANRLQARSPQPNDYAYALQSNVAKVMGHYAIYHRLYGLDNASHEAVVRMMEDFVASYDYYWAFRKMGPYFAKLCDLRRPRVVAGNNHCGSFNTRMAVGATLFGLEFENQTVFDKGVQNTEIMLAMFDENAMYTSQIRRGREGLSYADQVNPAIDQLDFAYHKAFGIDFANMRTVHGTTPGSVYEKMLKVAYNPALMLPYYDPDSDPTARYRGEFRDMIKDIQAGSRPPQDVWEAFQERRYILSAPSLARRYHPELFDKYWGVKNKFDYDFGNHITGFSPLTVREADWR